MKQLLLVRTPLLVAAALLSACHQPAPEVASGTAKAGHPPGAILSRDHDGGLYYDERYADSTDVRPISARTQREIAINTQLRRLHLARLGEDPTSLTATAETIDSVYEQVNGGRLVGYRNVTAQLADIHRKIDSLKVLEHIPLTPH